ncbi:MAG TPA: 2-hydroxyglutaryl-CoA dehydratase [Clostridiales bacterium]|jgi:predicted CoA-substrate-specific enzyme activase|nr:2-hydroxyglutaryl-CoA dehydratase [Clostridiales bacterium]
MSEIAGTAVSRKYSMGVDIGSTASKCIIMAEGKEIVAKSLIDVGAGTSGPDRVIAAVLKDSGLKLEDMTHIMSTGYGRHSLEIAHSEMSELSCHARGAYFQHPAVRTIIDIGGQDAKVMRIDENGILENFVMNDKCAAGTGRFLDVMARVLEVKLDDLEKLSAESQNEVRISSTCTVFAESEVISQLARNTHKRDIIKGIHRAVASRVGALARRIGLVDDVMMTGGVALNDGVRLALEEELEHDIFTTELAQYNGALGAALFAWQRSKKKEI